MKQLSEIGLILLFLLCTVGNVAADYLPNSTLETQNIRVFTHIDTVGVVIEKTTISWDVGTGGLFDRLLPGERQGSMTWTDSVMTNGGRFRETRTLNLDTAMKSAGMPNFDQSRVITYESEGSSHMLMDEALTIALYGSVSNADNAIMCVFSKPSTEGIPGFCNKASARSSLRSVTSAAITTTGSARITGVDASVPAALTYEISVMPMSDSVSGYADAIVSTLFALSIQEGRETDMTLDTWNQPALELSYLDASRVSGHITAFIKAFEYQSGLAISAR